MVLVMTSRAVLPLMLNAYCVSVIKSFVIMYCETSSDVGCKKTTVFRRILQLRTDITDGSRVASSRM